MVGARKTLSAIITLNCDGKCRHCYIDSQPRGETPELSLETWENVLDDFRGMGGQEFCAHGGEPLLYDGVGELIQHAHSIGLRTGIITNAIHLDDEFSQVLSACSTYALVSLDGPEDNYMNIRQVDKLDIVISNVDRLLAMGIKVHPIHMVHKQNVRDLSWIVDFCLSRNIPVVTLSPIIPIGRAEYLEELLLSPDELSVFIELFHELNRSYRGQVKFVTQSLYRPEDESKYLADEEKLKSYDEEYYFALNDGKLTADFDLPNPRDFILGDVLHLGSLDQQACIRYRRMLDSAFLRGLRELRAGKAINWYEVVRSEVLSIS